MAGRSIVGAARSVIALVFARGAKQGLGLLASALLAYHFGATSTTDAFLFARRLIHGVVDALGQVLRAVFVPPVVRRLKESGGPAVRGMVWGYVVRVGGVGLLAAACIALLAPWLVGMIVSGFDPQPAELASSVVRVLVFSVPAALVIALLSAFLNATRRFAAPAFVGEVLPPLFLCVSLAVLARTLGVVGLAWVLLVATLASAVLLVPLVYGVLAREEGGAETAEETKGPLELRGRTLPLLLMNGYALVVVQVDFSFASNLGPGSVSVLEYGYRLVQALPGLIVNSLMLVMLTELSHRVVEGGTDALRTTLVRWQRTGMFLMLPLVVAVMACADPIVELLLHRGAFDAEQAARTAGVLVWAGPSALISFLISAYVAGLYVDPDAPRLRVLGFATAAGLLARLGFDAVAARQFGVIGIAGAFTLSTLVLLLVLHFRARALWGALIRREDLVAYVKLLVAALAAAGAMQIGQTLHTPSEVVGFFGRLLYLLTLCGVGGAVYLSVAGLLGVQEMRTALELFRRRS